MKFRTITLTPANEDIYQIARAYCRTRRDRYAIELEAWIKVNYWPVEMCDSRECPFEATESDDGRIALSFGVPHKLHFEIPSKALFIGGTVALLVAIAGIEFNGLSLLHGTALGIIGTFVAYMNMDKTGWFYE